MPQTVAPTVGAGQTDEICAREGSARHLKTRRSWTNSFVRD
jgi:hypothetical protein